MIRIYENDHPSLHAHVFKDGRLIARYDLVHGCLMHGSDERHRGRVMSALREAGLI